MSDSYRELLERGWDEIPKVAPHVPAGTWRLKVKGASFKEPKQEGQNGYFLFVMAPNQPHSDVDDDALEALGEDYDYSGNRVFHQIWYETAADLQGLRDFLAKTGIPAALEGSPMEGLKAIRGAEIDAYLDVEMYKDRATGEDKTRNVAKSFKAVA